jgi:hypothetical protein
MCLRHDRKPPHACFARSPAIAHCAHGQLQVIATDPTLTLGADDETDHRAGTMHSSAHADTLAKRANGAMMPVSTRVTTSVWVVSQASKNHTFSARRNLQSYAEGGIAVHLQNAAKTDWLDR